MDALRQYLDQISSQPDSAQWFLSASIGLAIFLFVLAILSIFNNLYDPLRRRVRAVSDGSKAQIKQKATLSRAIEPFQSYVIPKKEKSRSNTQIRLIRAGYRSSNALVNFYFFKLALAISLGFLVVLAAAIHPRFTILQVSYAALVASFAGMLIPGLVLSHLVEKRQRLLMNSFPDALDLLVTCTEAGLGLNAAIERVSSELSVSHPALADEFALVNAETRAGVERIAALRNLAERTGLDDIRGLVSLLTQSLRFGTSIADTLRIYSEEFRDKRMQRAEELAAKVGTKMIFPLVFCLFPAFFVVAIGPAIMGVIRALEGIQ
jgi:tight adherence protein C